MTARAHAWVEDIYGYTCTYTWGCDLGESEVVVERETCERSVVCVCVCVCVSGAADRVASPRTRRAVMTGRTSERGS